MERAVVSGWGGSTENGDRWPETLIIDQIYPTVFLGDESENQPKGLASLEEHTLNWRGFIQCLHTFPPT
jgi:hypothetical protein